MAEYYEREKIIEAIPEIDGFYLECKLSQLPTIDIVHCSECKYCDEDAIARGVGWCDLFDGARSYDFFCADGERKE